MQSNCSPKSRRHVAIIMDGNGRWAQRRGSPRTEGHQAGGEAVRRIVEAAPDLGIGTLTLFAFAAANWQRPATEIAALMKLFHEYLVNETELCCRKGVRMSLLGAPRPATPVATHHDRRGRASDAIGPDLAFTVGDRLLVARVDRCGGASHGGDTRMRRNIDR